MITINSQFIADATRAHVDCDPRNNVGSEIINDLAAALQKSAAYNRTQATNSTRPIPQ